MRCPCKNCTERKLGCHGTCERYKAWKDYDQANKNDYKKRCELDAISWYARKYNKGVF